MRIKRGIVEERGAALDSHFLRKCAAIDRAARFKAHATERRVDLTLEHAAAEERDARVIGNIDHHRRGSAVVVRVARCIAAFEWITALAAQIRRVHREIAECDDGELRVGRDFNRSTFNDGVATHDDRGDAFDAHL